MGTAVVLHALFFLLVMAPSFLSNYEFLITETSNLGVLAVWLMVITGGISLILGIGIVAAWALRSSDIAACRRRKRFMDITFWTWIASILFGIVTYLIFYL